PLQVSRAGQRTAQEHLHRDKATEADLPGFVNHAHSAAGDFLKQFILAALPRELELRHQRPDGARLQVQRAAESADRAKALRGMGGRGRSALWTARGRWHRGLLVVGY